MQETQKQLQVEDVHLNKTVSLLNADAYHDYGLVKFDPYPIQTKEQLIFILDVIEMDKGFVRSI